LREAAKVRSTLRSCEIVGNINSEIVYGVLRLNCADTARFNNNYVVHGFCLFVFEKYTELRSPNIQVENGAKRLQVLKLIAFPTRTTSFCRHFREHITRATARAIETHR